MACKKCKERREKMKALLKRKKWAKDLGDNVVILSVNRRSDDILNAVGKKHS